MRTTYAVTWQPAGEEARSGCLELRIRGVVFEGETIPYDELLSVRIGRSGSDRLEGRQSLVLERREAAPIRIAGIAYPGIVAELADQLAVLI